MKLIEDIQNIIETMKDEGYDPDTLNELANRILVKRTREHGKNEKDSTETGTSKPEASAFKKGILEQLRPKFKTKDQSA